MKRHLIITSAVFLTAVTLPLRAQDTPDRTDKPVTPAQPDRTDTPGAARTNDAAKANQRDAERETDPAKTSRTGDSATQVPEHRRASQVIGMNIQNMQDEKIGAVEDLVLDLPSRRVSAVVISSGGFLGIADELSLVPPSALKLNAEGDAFSANITKDQLTNAPRFQGTDYPDLNDPKYMMSVYKAYNAESYLESISPDDVADDSIRRVVRATELIGLTVKNRQDDSIGDISEIVLNSSHDRISSFVVSSGGFLGIADTLSVLPAEAITVTKEAVIVDATKESLEQSPRFTAETWPKSMNDPDYLVNIYSPYQFRGDTKSDVDINANVDRKPSDSDKEEAKKDGNRKTDPNTAVTAQDQSNDAGDVAVTTGIRRKLVANDDFSFSAKNVRVITMNGKVTLAGQVASKEEKMEVEKIAKEESGDGMVTSQLTVRE